VLLCTVLTPIMLWPLQCTGLSTDLDILNIHSLATIQSESSSIIFDKLPQNDSITHARTEILEAGNSGESNDIETPQPLFQFFENSLSPTERKGISDFVQDIGLGPDPSSEHFLERTKNIRYIKVLEKG
ncbi:unnamed protein product, partial [Meganyctiphanes norvegica]